MIKPYRLYEYDMDAGLQIQIERHILNKQDYQEAHWHNYYELEFVLSGSGTHFLNNKEYLITPGSAYLLSYTDLHRVEENQRLELLNISFTDEIIDKALLTHIQDNSPLICNFSKDEFASLSSEFLALKDCLQKTELFHNELVYYSFNKALIKLLQKAEHHGKSTLPNRFQCAVQYVHLNYRHDLSLSQVAQSVGITPNYLGSCFKNFFGITYVEYLNNLRIKYAMRLLENTKLSCVEIGQLCGFNSPAYFIKIFKEKCKITPTVYRETL